MSVWFLVAPLLLLAIAGLAIMLLDAFSEDQGELAGVTAVSLAVAGAVAVGGLLSEGGVGEIPPYIEPYLAVDKLGLFFDVVICAGGALSALLAVLVVVVRILATSGPLAAASPLTAGVAKLVPVRVV